MLPTWRDMLLSCAPCRLSEIGFCRATAHHEAGSDVAGRLLHHPAPTGRIVRSALSSSAAARAEHPKVGRMEARLPARYWSWRSMRPRPVRCNVQSGSIVANDAMRSTCIPGEGSAVPQVWVSSASRRGSKFGLQTRQRPLSATAPEGFGSIVPEGSGARYRV
jgi:hypothetical protein